MDWEIIIISLVLVEFKEGYNKARNRYLRKYTRENAIVFIGLIASHSLIMEIQLKRI